MYTIKKLIILENCTKKFVKYSFFPEYFELKYLEDQEIFTEFFYKI